MEENQTRPLQKSVAQPSSKKMVSEDEQHEALLVGSTMDDSFENRILIN